MNGYLLSIIGTVLLSSVLTVVLPSGKTAGVIKGIAKLACVIAIVAPIPKFLDFDTNGEKNTADSGTNFTQSVIQTDESFIKYYCEMRVRSTQEALNKELAETFSVTVETELAWCFEDETEIDSDKILITKITVKPQSELSEKEKNAVWEYLTKNYCSEVLIE